MTISLANKLRLLIVLVGIIFIVEISGLIHLWLQIDGAYSHGVLLFAYSAWLCFIASKNVTKVKSSWLAGFTLIISILLWVLCRLMNVEMGAQAMWPVVTLATIATFWGWQNMWRLAIPIGLMLLAVPIWDYSGYMLQLLTVFMDQFLLAAVGVEFEIYDIYVTLPGKGTFEVAFGCSGVRYLLISLALSLIMAQQWLRTVRARTKIILAGIFLGLASNWLRVAIIIYVGDYTNMQSPLVERHETFGWILFAVMMLPLLWFGNRLESSERLQDSQYVLSKPAPHEQPNKVSFLVWAFVVLLAILSGWLWNTNDFSGDETQYRELPIEVSQWQQLPRMLQSPLNIYFNQPDVLWRSSYYRAGNNEVERLDGFIYQYSLQRSGQELVQSGNHFYDYRRYRVDNMELRKDGWKVMDLYDLKTRRSFWLLSGYMSADGVTSNAIDIKLALLRQPFRERNNVAAVAWVSSCMECRQNETLVEELIAGARRTFILGE